jgi:hypothetical protein
MIDRRQLAEALGRLDPRDREVLDYSMRRHVPDNDLAAVFDCGPSDVAKMRAAAVERLADDLGVQRGADLGNVLTALLHQSTWDLVPEAEPLDAGPSARETPPAEVAATVAAASTAAPAESVAAQEETPAPADDEPAPSATDSTRSGDRGPVLGMLARGADRPTDGGIAAGGRRWSIAIAALIAILATVGLGSVLLLGDDAGSTENANSDGGTRPFEPREEAIGEPFPSDPESAYRYPIAVVKGTTVLYDEPGGKPKVRISGKTEWDSPRVLSVVEREGDWLAVLVPELDNGEVGWLQESEVDSLDSVSWSLNADLSRRTLEVERNGEVIRTLKIGVGREDHPTPPGRYAVTDKLSVSDPGSPYGCCVVALTGHQTKLPDGWPGGDRLAIHATNDLSGLGNAVSLGCMRTDPDDARWMMDAVPLGTPVFVRE